MIQNCYLRKGIVYIPTLGRTKDRFYLEIDAVAVPVTDTAGLRRAFQERMARGNPMVPTPAKLGDASTSALLKLAGVRTYSAFERGAFSWIIEERDGVCRIIGQREDSDGGWVDDRDQTVTLPPGSTSEEVCERMIEILQAKARA